MISTESEIFEYFNKSSHAAGRGSSLREPRPKRFHSLTKTLRSRLQTGSSKSSHAAGRGLQPRPKRFHSLTKTLRSRLQTGSSKYLKVHGSVLTPWHYH
jgi:hypothetical protein